MSLDSAQNYLNFRRIYLCIILQIFFMYFKYTNNYEHNIRAENTRAEISFLLLPVNKNKPRRQKSVSPVRPNKLCGRVGFDCFREIYMKDYLQKILDRRFNSFSKIGRFLVVSGIKYKKYNLYRSSNPQPVASEPFCPNR